MRNNASQTEKFFADQLEVLGLTQAELAERAGFTPADISRYKSQKQRPRIEHIEQLAEALEVSVLEVMVGIGAIDPAQLSKPVVTRNSKGKVRSIKWEKK